MSLKENDLWLEGKKVEFEIILNNKEWSKISPLYIEMEEHGFSSEVVELSRSMTTDEVAEYKKWDVMTNGSIETQMDDNS